MKKYICSILTVLMLSTPAFAHRLNEYLEASTISLSVGKVSLELRLTPGVAVAGDVLKCIDINHDNQISPTEQQAYLEAIQHDITFAVDGNKTPLKVTSSNFPTAEAMEKGTGDIVIDFEVPFSANINGHQLQLKNAHFNTVAVYMANCLLPADSAIQVTSQTRSTDQSLYTLNFTTGGLKNGALPIPSTQTNNWAVATTFVLQGIRHILTGYDHLLFLCALVLGASSLWDLVKIITAFTVAHSITLTLAIFGLAHLPETFVEPMIAASIVFVAVQNMVWPTHANGNIRLAVAFFFGLFHGFGFAGGLWQLMHAMPAGVAWYSILGFSAGVEIGNQLVLLPLYGITRWLKNAKANHNKQSPFLVFKRYASGGVAIAGVIYLFINLYAALK